MSRYTILPGETAEQWRARDARLDVELAEFNTVLKNIQDLTRQVDRGPSTTGFMTGWLSNMFQNMSEEDRVFALERFRAYDGELLMIKMAGEPA
jgi:hypothetical protein